MTESSDHQPVAKKQVLKFEPVTAVLATLFMYYGSQILVAIGLFAYLFTQGFTLETIDIGISQLFNASNSAQLIFSGLIVVVALALMAWIVRLSAISWRTIGVKKPKWSDIGYVLLGFGAYFLTYMVILTAIGAIVPIDNNQIQELGYDMDTVGKELALIFIGLVVLPPIIEELVVRGYLYSGLRTKINFWPAAIISSLLFGAAHLNGGMGGSTIWIAAIDTFVLGMVLAAIREKTGRIWAPIGLHALKNGIAFTALFVLKVV